MCPALVSKGVRFWLNLHFLLLGSLDALSFGRGRDPRVDYHLVDGVSALGNDDLQVQVTHAWDYDGLGSGAVRVDRVGARARTPTRREEAVVGDRVNLPDVAFAVKGLQGDAIKQDGGAVGEEDGSVKGESVAAFNCGVAATDWVGDQSWRRSQSQSEQQ